MFSTRHDFPVARSSMLRLEKKKKKNIVITAFRPAMNSAKPLVSAITAGVLVFMQIWLMLAVVRLRRRNRQSLGDGGSIELQRAIRRHGNFAENAAIFVAGFALLELLGTNRMLLAGICAAFVAGRLIHAIGLSMKSEVNPWRTTGIFLTVLAGFSLAWRLIAAALPN